MESLDQPTIDPASSLFPPSVQVLAVVVPPSSATLVVCRREQPRTTDHLRPFPAQIETAHRTGKKAAEHTAPCCRKQRLEVDGVTALKVVAKENPTRGACCAFQGEQAVGLTLLASLMAHQGRPSKLTVAPLCGHKEESLLLCGTVTGLWTFTLLADHAASEHEE